MNTLLKNLTVEIIPVLFSAGPDECGTDYVAETFRVVAEDADGNRWMHPSAFAGCRREEDDEGGVYFVDLREVAEAKANVLLARMVRAGAVDLRIWDEDHPAYGSKAYQAYGAANDCYEDRFGDQD